MKLLGLSIALLAFGLVGQANAIDLFAAADYRTGHDNYLNHSTPVVQSSTNHNSWMGGGSGYGQPDFNSCCDKPRRCRKLFSGIRLPKLHISCCPKPRRNRCCKPVRCCKPKPCCKPAPVCCKPKPCCDPCDPCCRKHRLFGWLKSLHNRCCESPCGESACGCGGDVEGAVEHLPAEEPPQPPAAA